MKKNKVMSILTLPLILIGSSGIILSQKTNNSDEVKVRREIKETNDLISNGHIKDVSLGEEFSGAIITDVVGKDHLYMWGDNGYGQLGQNYSSTSSNFPLEVTYNISGQELNQIELGGDHALLSTTDSNGKDHLYSWGLNTSYQLGIGNKNEKHVPTVVNTVENFSGEEIVQIDAGRYSSMMVTRNSLGQEHLYTWGNNNYGQLASGYAGGSYYKSTPYQVTYFNEGDTFKEIEMSLDYSAAIVVDSLGQEHLYTWGSNTYGKLGYSLSGTYIKYPKEVTFSSYGVKELNNLSMGWYHTGLSLTDYQGNDHLLVWGENLNGELGLNGVSSTHTPTELVNFVNSEIVDVSFGSSHSGIVTEDANGDNHLFTWGMNTSGELGWGIISDEGLVPTEVQLPDGNYDIEFGFHISSTIVTDEFGQNSLYIWGDNNLGANGNGSTINNSNPGVLENFGNTEIRTTVLEKVSSKEYVFEIESSNESSDASKVDVYNSKGVIVGKTTLIENDKKDLDYAYDFNTVITNVDAADGENIYWSVDGGKTLNLISEQKYVNVKDDNGNVVLYSLLGVGFVILLILVIIFVVLFLSKDDEKEDNSTDYMGSNDKNSKREKKSKKQREKEMMDQRNSVLDAF